MKEGKEKDARYTNGHLFTTITVSGMTMCFACNKSITAKEALICPSECPGARVGLRGSVGVRDCPSGGPQSSCRGSCWDLRVGQRARGCCRLLCAAGRGRLPARCLFWGCSIVVWGCGAAGGVPPRAGRAPQTPLQARQCPGVRARDAERQRVPTLARKSRSWACPTSFPCPSGCAGGLLGTPGCLILLGAEGSGSGAPRGLSCCQQLRFLAPATSARQQLAGAERVPRPPLQLRPSLPGRAPGGLPIAGEGGGGLWGAKREPPHPGLLGAAPPPRPVPQLATSPSTTAARTRCPTAPRSSRR